MAKVVVKVLDDLSSSAVKLRNLPRKPDGLHNLYFNEYGQLVKRKGYTKYNTDSLGTGHKILGMHRFYKEDTSSKAFLVAWNTGVYVLADTSPHGGTAIKTGLTADYDTYFCDFGNRCYFVNGKDGVFKYDMTDVYSVGITPPTAPTFNSNIDGSLETGTYKFKVTYVDTDGYESNPSDASADMTASADPNDGIKINIPVSADSKVAKRRIYRTSVNGAIYYYDGEVADNTTTTYDSTQPDTTLGSEVETDHNIPSATAHAITKRGNRLYIADNDYLYISYLSDVEYFPSLWAIRTGNSEKITGIIEQMNALPVFTEDSIERLVGTDEDNFEFRNAYSTEGCIAPRSLVNCKNLLVYLGYNGINYFDGVSTGTFSKIINEYLKENINDSYRHLSCATFFDDKYMLCYPKGSNTVPSETIWIDLSDRTYGTYDFAFSCFSKWNRSSDGLQLYGGSNTEGRVYKVFDGLNDDGSDITAYDRIEPLDFGAPERWKQFYHLYIKVKTTSGTALRFYYQLDDNSETYKDITLTANTTRWYMINLEGGGQRGRAISLRPCMSDQYDFTIMGYMIVFEFENPEYA